MRGHELVRLALGIVAGVSLLAVQPAQLVASGRPGVVAGVVLDTSGSGVGGARVSLLTGAATEIQFLFTSDDGVFVFESVEPAAYVVDIEKAGFQKVRKRVIVTDGQATRLPVTLEVGAFVESVTVTATRGTPQDVSVTAQFATVTNAEEMARRGFSIFPQALAEEPGVHVQQTSTSQGSPFVRGLTGQQVVVLVDGVRFNNATFRPGANQYTALIDPGMVDRAEIVRGPSAAQYGSDSLGGAINILTSPGRAVGDRITGEIEVGTATADLSVAVNTWVAASGRGAEFLVGASGRRNQDLRTGGGVDSHSVATRLLGLASVVLGERLDQTAYTQHAMHAKALIHATTNDAITVRYARGAQFGASRYDQLNGGAGNVLNRFDPQSLDFFTARYDRLGAAWFDSLSSTVSFNRQRDDRTYQSINNAKLGLRSPVTEERNATNVFGYQVQAARQVRHRHSLVFGGELYEEDVQSTRTDTGYNAATGAFTDAVAVRGRFPNGARYRSLGLFAQGTASLSTSISATGAVRYSRFGYRQSADDNVSGSTGPLVPDYATAFDDTTFNVGLVYAVTDRFVLTGTVSRGFRAPNVSDFGSIGISGLGFEVSPAEALAVGALAAPLSGTGEPDRRHASPARPLVPERAYNYEAGARVHFPRLNATAVWFDSEIADLIERRSVLMMPGAVGREIGGETIIRQDESGAVYTALASSPVFVRANGNAVRLRGGEGTVTWRVTDHVTMTANVATIRGAELATGLPPNLENGIPPTHGFAGIRFEHPGARWWIEGYSRFAAAQRRFSSSDLEQARIGGIRTRSEITNFFNNGAVARGLVRDGILIATGETLSQVIARVLGPDPAVRVPFLLSNAGFATVNVRGGVRLPRGSRLTIIAENVLDTNYRLMGSGIDAAGVNLRLLYALTF